MTFLSPILKCEFLFNYNHNDFIDKGFRNLWQWVESQLITVLSTAYSQLADSEWATAIHVTIIRNLSAWNKLEENFVQILHGEYFYCFIFFLHTQERTVWISFPQKQWWAWSIYLRSSDGLRKCCLRFELSESQRLVMNYYYKITEDLVIIQQLLEKHWEYQTYSQRG